MFSLKKKTTAVVLASGLALSLGVATDLLLGQSHQVQADTHQLEEDNPLNISYNQYKTVEKWYTYQDSLIPLTFTNKGDKTLTITKTEFADSLEDWDSFFFGLSEEIEGKTIAPGQTLKVNVYPKFALIPSLYNFNLKIDYRVEGRDWGNDYTLHGQFDVKEAKDEKEAYKRWKAYKDRAAAKKVEQATDVTSQ